MLRITDQNYRQYAQAAQHAGLCGALPRKSQIGSLTYARPYAEVIDLIPESKYGEYYEQMKGKFPRQRKEKYNPALQYQGPHPLCWAYALAQHLECVRAKENLMYIQLAPESITGVCGYQDIGYYLDKALGWITESGMAPRSLVPQYNLNESSWDKTYKERARDFIPLERFDLGTKDMWAEIMTALLTGDSVYLAYNWWRHALNAEELVLEDNEYKLWLPNTHGAGQDVLLSGSKKIPDEAYVVRSITYSK